MSVRLLRASSTSARTGLSSANSWAQPFSSISVCEPLAGDVSISAHGEEILLLRGVDGAILWRGRVVTTDPDLVAALRDVAENRR